MHIQESMEDAIAPEPESNFITVFRRITVS